MNTTELKALSSAVVSAGSKVTVKTRRKVCGVGINDCTGDCFALGKSGNMTAMKYYSVWISMINRCYSPKANVAYKDCTVCDEWLTLSEFKKWHDSNYVEGWHIDKDIINIGNKSYNPSSCRYVPREINVLIINSAGSRGDHPLGVCWSKKYSMFQAQFRSENKIIYLGYFKTSNEAEISYLINKSAHMELKIKSYIGTLGDDVISALMLRVEIMRSEAQERDDELNEV